MNRLLKWWQPPSGTMVSGQQRGFEPMTLDPLDAAKSDLTPQEIGDRFGPGRYIYLLEDRPGTGSWVEIVVTVEATTYVGSIPA